MTVLAAGGTPSGDPFIFLQLAVLLLAGYWLPSIVAFWRHVPNKASAVVINLFLGWTFVWWVVALAMSLRTAPPRSPAPLPRPSWPQLTEWPCPNDPPCAHGAAAHRRRDQGGLPPLCGAGGCRCGSAPAYQ